MRLASLACVMARHEHCPLSVCASDSTVFCDDATPLPTANSGLGCIPCGIGIGSAVCGCMIFCECCAYGDAIKKESIVAVVPSAVNVQPQMVQPAGQPQVLQGQVVMDTPVMTAAPLGAQPMGIQANTSAPAFDPDTGKPLAPAPIAFGAKFDPNTGQPIPKFDPTTGQQNW